MPSLQAALPPPDASCSDGSSPGKRLTEAATGRAPLLPQSAQSDNSCPRRPSQMVKNIDLSGKNVLITGGGRGLGTNIAKAYAAAGANLVLTCKLPGRLTTPQRAEGFSVLTLWRADNATPADEFAAKLAKEFGVKVLVSGRG